jgi:acyl-CoA thioester hydrolase
MIHRFVRRFRVRHYELDAYGHLHGVNLVRYMQEAAIEASTDLGFSPDWYRERGMGWVVGRLSVRFLSPAFYSDELEVATWLSSLRGVRSIREYDVTRKSDSVRVARGRAEWVYMDFQTGQPTRIPDAWADAFTPQGKPEDLGIRLNNGDISSETYRHTSRRRVQFHELDAVEHVNHSVYLQWIEQACRDILPHPEHARMHIAGHQIQYFGAALDQEGIEIVSWVSQTQKNALGWTHEISNVQTKKLLARDYSCMSFVNTQRQFIEPSQDILAVSLEGPKAS